MDIGIKLPESCSNSILAEGSRLLQSDLYFSQERDLLPDGGIRLQAKVRDKFYFVDHPWVDLDAAGSAVTGFRCDCPAFQASRGFCAHCAALVLDFAQLWNTVLSSGPDFSQTDAEESDEESVDEFTEEDPADSPLPQLTDFSYTFCNSAWDLYPRVRDPRIPQERYIQAFGDNARARALYRMAGVWGGSCFGIASTVTMFQQDKEDTRISDFNPHAAIPSELLLSDRHTGLDLTVHQFVELMQILQYSQLLNRVLSINLQDPQCLAKLAERVRSFQQGRDEPVVMCVWASPKMDGGHAILPYRLETTGDTEDILHIYDPNWPLKVRYAYLTKDDQGNYLNWRFAMNDRMTYSGDVGSQLSMSPYETYTAAWDNRAGAASDNLLSVASGVAIQNSAGELLARVTEQGVEIYGDGISQIPLMAGHGNDNVMLSIPAGCYRFCQENPMAGELAVHMTGTDLSVSLSTTAREAAVQVDDGNGIASVEISQADSRYSIEIFSTAAQTREEIFLGGVVGETALQLAHKDGRLYADGLTRQCALYINDVQQPLDSIRPLTEEIPEEIPQESEQELVLNAADDGKKADSES